MIKERGKRKKNRQAAITILTENLNLIAIRESAKKFEKIFHVPNNFRYTRFIMEFIRFLLAIYFGFRKASIFGASLPFFTSLQALGELFSIVYFIRPYRVFVLRSLKRLMPKQNISRVFRLTPMPPVVA